MSKQLLSEPGLTIDQFGTHAHYAWISAAEVLTAEKGQEVEALFKKTAVVGAVIQYRPKDSSGGKIPKPEVWFGTPPSEPFVTDEGELKFWIRFNETHHPGLFLDHAPLRTWLKSQTRFKNVLNLFSYTGSLSIAAAYGRDVQVTSIDLSSRLTEWAKENWALNGLAAEAGRFISGDVFDWLPRLAKKGERFDLVIVDPPSFSRSKTGTFSTQKDLVRLHEKVLPLVDWSGKGGVLISSINSASVTLPAFEAQVYRAAESCGVRLELMFRIHAPLKGGVFQVLSKTKSSGKSS